MEIPKLAPALGNYAATDRLWGRDREVAEVAGYLRGGTSVLVSGPRRIGKTSIMHAVEDAVAPMRTVFVDVENCADPTEMFASLAAVACADAGAWTRIRAWFGQRLDGALDRLDSVGVGVLKVELHAAMAGSWREDARAVVAALAAGTEPTVVIVDELPLLVDRVLRRDANEAELLMATLRAMAAEFPQVRWLVGGSIGLESVLHRAGLTGLITHLRPYLVDAWDEETTHGAVDALAAWSEIRLEPGTAKVVYDLLGLGVPYHVQVVMDEVRRDAERRDRSVDADDVIRVYDSPQMATALNPHLLHLESRLRNVLGEGDALRLAWEILTHAAVTGVVTADDATAAAAGAVENQDDRAATVREVLEILEHDVYLERTDAGWRFRSRLVAEWWRRRNGWGARP